MSVNKLPPEILQEIFKNLSGAVVLKCRIVCTAWKEAVDGLSDTQWHKICEEEYNFPVYKKVQETSSMSWRDTYIALHSWGNINSANLECRQLPGLRTPVQQFKILPNRMIAVISKLDSVGPCLSDTIVYYNIDSLKEVEKKTYEPFRDYDENEHLIVILHHSREILVVQKANNKQEVVGKVCADHWHVGGFGLFGKKVYFQNEDNLICISKLKKTEGGESIIKTAPLRAFKENYDSFEEYVVSFGYMDDHLTILTDEGNVYEYVDQDFGMLSKFRSYSGNIITELYQYGFDWTSPQLYVWLLSRHRDNLQTSKINHQSIVIHSPVVLVGELNKPSVHLFYFPFFQAGEFADDGAGPNRIINMNKFAKIGLKNSIYQMAVVESADHHIVIVLTGEKVFILKFDFNASKETGSEGGTETQRASRKRKAAKNTQPKTKAKKVVIKPKAKPQKHNEPKHRYNTRSTREKQSNTLD